VPVIRLVHGASHEGLGAQAQGLLSGWQGPFHRVLQQVCLYFYPPSSSPTYTRHKSIVWKKTLIY